MRALLCCSLRKRAGCICVLIHPGDPFETIKRSIDGWGKLKKAELGGHRRDAKDAVVGMSRFHRAASRPQTAG